ncbi:MAG: molybdopterin dehydrogenase, FAD-binding protein [Proteobacteria bacterium]|nr:molybdopterin dehydrogenase, FAD-binding protein [Pseudomonadota bacterium]
MSAWFSPDSIDDALALIERHPDARLIAGGTDLLVRRRSEMSDIPLISLERVAALQGIEEVREDGMLAIGAATRIAELAVSPLLAANAPLLQRAALSFGAPAIRNMASVGGNLCTASPAGDCLPPLHALGAQVELIARAGRRRLPISDFIVGPGRTSLAPGEIVTRVLLPSRDRFAWQAYEKIGRRQSLAISVVSFAALLRLDDEQRIAEAHLAWGSVGPTVVTAPELANWLLGKPLDQSLIDVAAERARAAVCPIDDLRAGADYRRALAGNLLRRFLRRVQHG